MLPWRRQWSKFGVGKRLGMGQKKEELLIMGCFQGRRKMEDGSIKEHSQHRNRTSHAAGRLLWTIMSGIALVDSGQDTHVQ